MAHDEGAVCLCCADHRPPVLEYERHHVHPIYLGSDEDSETVWVCSNCHGSVHEILRLMLKSGALLSYSQVQALEDRPVSRYAYTLAAEGYRRWAASTLL